MKAFLRKIVLWLLKVMAKHRLKSFRGKIIAVTGSVGKTSTKDAIFSVLNTQLKVKRNKKSMNSDFGLPLTILDIDSGYSSVTRWAWLLLLGFVHSLTRDVNDVLLFELGVDKPGDMDFLTSIIKPDIAVLTNIHPLHLAEGQFKDTRAIFEEKSKLVDAVKDGGIVILNIDNPFLDTLAGKCKRLKVITFGQNKKADFYASRISYDIEGLRFLLHHGDQKYEVKARLLGEYQAYVLMPAVICAQLAGVSAEDAVTALERFSLPPGRMNIIEGKKDSTILDSSYNSSPAALKEALMVLKHAGEKRRKVAVLGNMNELGEKSADLHREIGDIAGDCCDLLLTVGVDAKLIGERAVEKGMKEDCVVNFRSAPEAAEYFKEEVKEKDVILVKGSQNRVRLERFVKEIMARPEEAKELLVRQEKEWLDKI